MYREWRNPWPWGYRCYRSRLLRKGNKLNIVLRNCKIVIEMKLEMSEYHDNNWFLGSRKVYEPLVTISGGKIYQTFLQVGSWIRSEISTMAHDYEISPSNPIFKNQENTIYPLQVMIIPFTIANKLPLTSWTVLPYWETKIFPENSSRKTGYNNE